MGVLDVVRGRKDTKAASAVAGIDDPTQQPTSPNDPTKTEHDVKADRPESVSGNSERLSLEARNEKEVEAHPDTITKDAQAGVRKAEAAALVYGKKTVWALYAWIWVCFFMLAFQSAIGNNVIFYAYADFANAPQLATAGICASIIGGILKLVIAKCLNIWGRAEAFLFFVGVYVIGIIVIASCNGPDGYAAGYVLYWIGYDAIYLILDVFIADLTGLRNRAFAWAWASTPFIATAFIGPRAAQSFLSMATWRWAYGAFAIIMPVVFVPLAVVFKVFQKKAEKLGIYHKEKSGRTLNQSVVHYFHEFDVIGAFILMAAFLLFLLPFSLSSYGLSQYSSPTFIAMVVVGILLFPVFAVWEKFGTRTHFIRWELFKQRTVLGACLCSAIVFYAFYSWDVYFVNFVTIVYDLNVSDAGYMGQIYNIGSCFWGVVFGVYIRYTKHFKYACLFFGLPLMILGAGLMIHFRGEDANIGYLVMCQLFIACSGGTLVIGEDMAVMSAADRDGIPMMLSILGLSSSLGGAIGGAVCAAIYNNMFVKGLTSALPSNLKDQATTIYLSGITGQELYPVGSATRDAINYAWGYSQKYNCISATAALVLAFPCIAMWKNYNVDRKQVKGTVL